MKSYMIISVAMLGIVSMYAQDNSYQSEKLIKVWETKGLDVPESVLPVPEKNIMYISNIAAQNPSEKNQKGFISILDMDGKVKELNWATGLNSPKGLGIYKDFLYVTEVDHITRIDLKNGEKVKSFKVEGAKFLNDVAVGPDGTVYFTDSGTGAVHKLEGDAVKVFLKEGTFKNPNGIMAAKEKLYIGTGEKIASVDIATGKMEDVLVNTGAADGIARIGGETFLFSDWPGTIHIMKAGDQKELLLDTSKSGNYKTADFGFIAEDKKVIVPTFFGNSVVCYELKL